MDPNIWGPAAWKFLHSVTLAYPECPNDIDKTGMKNFFTNLKYVLPCNSCKNHFTDNLSKYPLTDDILCSKEKLVKWLIDIHNEVNKMNGKPIKSYIDMLSEFDNMYYNNRNIYYKYIIIMVIILIVLILLFLFLFFQ